MTPPAPMKPRQLAATNFSAGSASAPPTLERTHYEPHYSRERDCTRAFIAFIVAGLVLSKSYFNAKELQALLDGAAEQGIGYEVQIHNPWTGDYSFHPEAG